MVPSYGSFQPGACLKPEWADTSFAGGVATGRELIPIVKARRADTSKGADRCLAPVTGTHSKGCLGKTAEGFGSSETDRIGGLEGTKQISSCRKKGVVAPTGAWHLSPITFGLRFVIASCMAQFFAEDVGTIMFDLTFSPTTDDSLATYFTGIMRLIPYSWMLALEPLTIAVVLAMCSSVIETRRNWITMIVVVTLLNALASTMCIMGRSL